MVDLRGHEAKLAVALMTRKDVEAFKGAEIGSDARVLKVDLLGRRRVRRQWRDVCAMFSVSTFDDFAVPGPRTTAWCCEFVNRRGGGPRDHHKWWKATNRLFDDMWGVAEHSLAMLVLRLAGCYDALDVVNVSAVELLMRKAQLIESSYSSQGPAPPPGGDGDKDKKKGGGKGHRVGMYEECHLPRGPQGVPGVHGVAPAAGVCGARGGKGGGGDEAS